jgi:hypothetical protein
MSPIEAAAHEAALSQFGVEAKVHSAGVIISADGEIVTDVERILPALALADALFEALTGQRSPVFREQFERAAKRVERYDHEALFARLRRDVHVDPLLLQAALKRAVERNVTKSTLRANRRPRNSRD